MFCADTKPPLHTTNWGSSAKIISTSTWWRHSIWVNIKCFLIKIFYYIVKQIRNVWRNLEKLMYIVALQNKVVNRRIDPKAFALIKLSLTYLRYLGKLLPSTCGLQQAASEEPKRVYSKSTLGDLSMPVKEPLPLLKNSSTQILSYL